MMSFLTIELFRLDYPMAKYADFENNCPFTFEMNADAVYKGEKDCGFHDYVSQNEGYLLKLSPVNNDNALLKDAQTLTYKHVIKADDILEPYLNPEKKVYGMFYQVVMQQQTSILCH
jgi:gliding motility-associated lipoprotein GldD